MVEAGLAYLKSSLIAECSPGNCAVCPPPVLPAHLQCPNTSEKVAKSKFDAPSSCKNVISALKVKPAPKGKCGKSSGDGWTQYRANATCLKFLAPINPQTGKSFTNPKVKGLGKKISTNTFHGIDSVNDLRSWSLCPEDRRRHYLEQLRSAEIDDEYLQEESNIVPVMEVEHIGEIIGADAAAAVSLSPNHLATSSKPTLRVGPTPILDAVKKSSLDVNKSKPTIHALEQGKPAPSKLTIAPVHIVPETEIHGKETSVSDPGHKTPTHHGIVEIPVAHDEPILELSKSIDKNGKDPNSLAASNEINEAINNTNEDFLPETEPSKDDKVVESGLPIPSNSVKDDAGLLKELERIEGENLPLITESGHETGAKAVPTTEKAQKPSSDVEQVRDNDGSQHAPTGQDPHCQNATGQPGGDHQHVEDTQTQAPKFPCEPQTPEQAELLRQIYQLQKEKAELESRIAQGLGSPPIQKEFEETQRKLVEMQNLVGVLTTEKQEMEAEIKRLTDANKERAAQLDALVKRMEADRNTLQEEINHITRLLQTEIRERRCLQSRFNNARQRLDNQKAVDNTLKLENQRLQAELIALRGQIQGLYDQVDQNGQHSSFGSTGRNHSGR